MFSKFLYVFSTFTIAVCYADFMDNEDTLNDKYPWDNRFYLVSYTRSGNGWTRELIEEATGIVTSTVYNETKKNVLKKVFPWGGYCFSESFKKKRRSPEKHESIIVKTHYPQLPKREFDHQPCVGTVRIIRHPVDSFYSWYVLINKFKEQRPEYRIPRKTLIAFIESWKEFQDHWDIQENVLNVRYEDLYENPSEWLKLILIYSGYTVSDDDIQRAVLSYPPKGYILKHIHHFTDDDLKLIDEHLNERMSRYGYSINEVYAHY